MAQQPEIRLLAFQKLFYTEGSCRDHLSKQFDVSYPTAWLMLHKIRNAMKQKDSSYKLANIVELDESLYKRYIPRSRLQASAKISR